MQVTVASWRRHGAARRGKGRLSDGGVSGAKAAELASPASDEAWPESEWEGPLPPPAVLAQYERILPSSAERIFSMVETATVGAMRADGRLADAEIEQARTGQAMAFVIASVAVGATIVFFASGTAVPGGLLLSFPVIMLVRALLPRR